MESSEGYPEDNFRVELIAGLLDQAKLAETVSQKVDPIQQDFEVFLALNGVSFGLADLPDYVIDPEATKEYIVGCQGEHETELGRYLNDDEADEYINRIYIDLDRLKNEYIQALATIKDQQAELLVLANTLADIEEAISKDNLSLAEQTHIKKRLMARSIIKGETAAWRKLIAEKFPGDGLSEVDSAIFAEEVLVNTIRSEVISRHYHSERNEIVVFLSELGEDITSLKTSNLINQLMVLRLRAMLSNNPSAYIEEARLIVIDSGLDSPVWERLVKKLFNPD
jgi:hypothetical protein